MTNEERTQFNRILMVMNHSERSKKWFLRHSYSEEILEKMVDINYLISYEKDGEIYYRPTQKSHELW